MRLTRRGWTVLYIAAAMLGTLLGLTAQLWDPWAMTP